MVAPVRAQQTVHRAKTVASALEKAVVGQKSKSKPLPQKVKKAEMVSVQTLSEAEKKLRSKISSGNSESLIALGKFYMNELKYSSAEPFILKAIKDLQTKRLQTQEAQKLLETCRLGEQMLKGTEKINVIDSFVVNKDKFLSAYKLSEATGSLDYFAHFFNEENTDQSTVYKAGFGDRIY